MCLLSLKYKMFDLLKTTERYSYLNYVFRCWAFFFPSFDFVYSLAQPNCTETLYVNEEY